MFKTRAARILHSVLIAFLFRFVHSLTAQAFDCIFISL